MFKRRWKWFGKLKSDEGFDLAYGNKSITYRDGRGAFQFGLEDGYLFPSPLQVSGNSVQLNEAELSEMISRVMAGIEFEGHRVQIWHG